MTQVESVTSVTLRLKQAELALRVALRPVLAAEGIAFEHWQVLAALLEQSSLRMTDLAEAAVLPAATLTRHVERLLELELVSRRVDPGDKRRAVVTLTPAGADVAQRLRQVEADAKDVTGRG